MLSGKKRATFSRLNQAFHFPSCNSQSHWKCQVALAIWLTTETELPNWILRRALNLMKSQMQQRGRIVSLPPFPRLSYITALPLWQMSVFTLSAGRNKIICIKPKAPQFKDSIAFSVWQMKSTSETALDLPPQQFCTIATLLFLWRTSQPGNKWLGAAHSEMPSKNIWRQVYNPSILQSQLKN